MNRIPVIGLVALVFCGGCGQRAADTGGTLSVAVANSYLGAAVRELLGTGIAVVALAEPGACPGHFDIRPSQIEQLRRCRMLFRFDFQESLDGKLVELTKAGLGIVPVEPGGGLCEPATYLRTCRLVADALVERGFLDRRAAASRLTDVEQRIQRQTEWAQAEVAASGLAGRPVVVSKHQANFCRFLGLDVVATFSGTDVARVSEIEEAIRRGSAAELIIANLPEGRRLADALAERLEARVVVLGNFPDAANHAGRFDELFHDNVQRLIAAAAP